MKNVKYYSSFIIFLIAWLLISELYVLHMENFQSEFPYMTFYRTKKVEQEIMLEDIEKSATKNSLKIFLVEQNINSLSSKTINIYSTTDLKKELKKEAFVSQGSYNSFFLGNIEVCYKKWSQIENIDDFFTYYYVGRKEDAIELKKELVDQYGGKFPQDGYITLNYERNVILIWIMAFSFLVLLSIYQNLVERKTVAIRVLMGESSRIIALKSFVLDVIVFSMEFVILQMFVALYGNTFISNKVSYLIFIGFIVVDLLLYISCLNINFQKSLKNTSGKWVLGFSYGYKIVVISVFIVLVSGCVNLIFSGIDYYKQKSFFMEHKNYSYSKIELDDSEQTIQMRYKFYNKFTEEGKAITLNQINSSSTSDKYIYANSGAVAYLKDKIPELNKMDLEQKVYFLLPEGIEDKDVKDVKETWESYYHGEYESEEIPYIADQKIISTFRPNSLSINSSREKEYILILNTMKLDNRNFINPYLIDNTMYNISQKEWNDFLDENGIDKNLSCLTNVYENYQSYWKQNQRLLILGAGVFALLLLLESIITNTILHYEYQMNAIEIIIKKFLGYAFIQRYKSIIFITLIGDIIGIIISAMLLINSNSLKFSFFGAVILCSLEIVILTKKTIHLESQQINKILKGGVL